MDTGVPPVSGFEIVGEITSGVGGVQAKDVKLSYYEAECGRTPNGYRCIVPNLAIKPTLTVFGYSKGNTPLYACSPAAANGGLGSGVQGTNTATFALPLASLSVANIVIQNTPCSQG